MFGAFSFNFNLLFCQNCFFPEGMDGVHILVEIQKGWLVDFVFKKWKFRGGGGRDFCEIPSIVGGYTFSGT